MLRPGVLSHVARSACAVGCVLAVGACGQASAQHSLRSEASAGPEATPTAGPTADPTVDPTAAPTVAAATLSPAPVRATAVHTAVHTASPLPVRTTADPRPHATVVVLNNASMTVKVVIGDASFRLASGARSAVTSFHVDPGGNTGVGVERADGIRCGQGGPEYLKAEHRYVYTVTETADSCTEANRTYAAPHGTISENG